MDLVKIHQTKIVINPDRNVPLGALHFVYTLYIGTYPKRSLLMAKPLVLRSYLLDLPSRS